MCVYVSVYVFVYMCLSASLCVSGVLIFRLLHIHICILSFNAVVPSNK